MGTATNPAVLAVLEEIARAKERAEERRRAAATAAAGEQYGVIRSGSSGEVVLRLPPAPLQPAPDDCCHSGCTPCILDAYRDRLHAYSEDVKALRAQYERVLAGEELSLGEHHIRHALPGGVLEPLQFSSIAVHEAQEVGDGGRMVMLAATALDFVLAPGEHVQIRASLGDGWRATRAYTPVMVAARDGIVRPHLFVRVYGEAHRVSQFWRAVAPGQRLAVRGPVESQTDMTRALSPATCVLVAGGSGIAPIFHVLQFASVNSAYSGRRIVVMHCARSAAGLWLSSEIAALSRDLPGLEYHPFVSHEPTHAHHGRLTESLLWQVMGPLDGSSCAAVVCGPDSFNCDVKLWLQDAGISDIKVLDS
ncbi:NADH-cytochrome b5 reductase-like [Coemansia thaxteri]|uniref:NADH-cytochrome b5 reductase-like n=1 Tax=Coemansia thaxteri TaxID=2663907 RepID=A0A9W8EJ47_9FUNG|nr:NADH-cytochrome b5 reductase-like [Coemansia thaxteri]KAJ2477947.1 NADH-cytochrome b5 reductase-like [Coemansia sp. RSA 2320]